METSQFTQIRPKLTMKKMSVIKPELKPISDETFEIRKLQMYSEMYYALSTFRREAERVTKYFNGDQWHELTQNRYGETMREDEYISSQGQIPIKQNVIKPTIRSLQGQFRSNTTKSVVVARTPEKGKESEMLSNTLQYSLTSVNDSKEVDAATLEKMLLLGLGVQKLSWEYIPDLQRKDSLIRDISIYNMFFNGDIEDVRGNDLRTIGQLLDLTKEELIMHFGKTPQREAKLKEIYSGNVYESYDVPEALDPDQYYMKDFYMPNSFDKCRVISVWEKRIVKQMEVHDWMDGKIYYTDWTAKDLDQLNAMRIEQYATVGVMPEDVPIMEGTFETVQKWFYTFYSPWGHVIEEGETPFKHGTHPFCFYIHRISDGKIIGLGSDLIDTQRQLNRLRILNDRILASSVKNTMLFDKNAMDGQTKDEIGNDMKEVGGLVIVDVPKGSTIQNVATELKGSIGNLGIPEMIEMYMRTLQDI